MKTGPRALFIDASGPRGLIPINAATAVAGRTSDTMDSIDTIDTIEGFLEYMGLRGRASGDLCIIRYGDNPNVRLSSPPIRTGLYHISLKEGFEQIEPLKGSPTSNAAPDFAAADHAGENANAFMFLSQPGQIMEWNASGPWHGYQLMMTRELFESQKHLQFSFLSYGQHEALFLLESERVFLDELFQRLYAEQDSQALVLAHCHLILAYMEKFYARQFESRKPVHHRMVADFRALLAEYYSDGRHPESLPSVQSLADRLFVSPGYLSDLMRYHTGKSALQHIHETIIDEARARLRKSSRSVTEIAMDLGFEYPTYFARLFKQKTSMTPSEYRKT